MQFAMESLHSTVFNAIRFFRNIELLRAQTFRRLVTDQFDIVSLTLSYNLQRAIAQT